MLNLYQYHSRPQQLMGYADATNKIPEIAWKAAKTPMQKRKLEHVWTSNAEYAYEYALNVIKKRWPPGEAAIAGDPEYAARYARDIIKNPWPPGEAAIASTAESAYWYTIDLIGKRWPPGEAVIAGDAVYSKAYQKEFKVKLLAR